MVAETGCPSLKKVWGIIKRKVDRIKSSRNNGMPQRLVLGDVLGMGTCD